MAAFLTAFPALASSEPLVLSTNTEALNLEVDAVEYVASQGRHAVHLRMTKTSNETMDDLTERALGETLTMSLCGKVLVRAVVRERISGRAVIDAPGPEAAAAIRDVIRGDADCAAIAQHFPD